MKTLMNPAAQKRIWRSLLALLFLSLATATVSAAIITVENTNDAGAGSLRQAILDNGTMGGGNTIAFSNTVTGTIGLTTGFLVISNDVSIVGPGSKLLTVSGSGIKRVFNIYGSTVAISGLRIFNGIAGEVPSRGGGINHTNGSLTLQECDIDSNRSESQGCGIYNSTTLILDRCTVRNNYGGNPNTLGAGIYNLSPGTVTIRNSTISGNSVGGGIYSSSGTVRITSSTIVSNSSFSSSSSSSGGITGGSLFVTNCIIAGNSALNGGKPDISSTFIGDAVSGGYNIIGNTNGNTTSSLGFTKTGDQRNVNPLLGPLADNGGPTPTHAPLSNSPAIDKGKSFALTIDQRGFLRPFDFPDIANASGGDGTDIGAFEYVPSPTLNILHTENYSVISWLTNSPPCTLQSTTNLPSTDWSPVSDAPTIVGNQFCVTNSPVGETLFYRLRGN